MTEISKLTENVTDSFMGHWFGDWNHGIDHHKCGHCGLYQHSYEQDASPCTVARTFHQPTSGILEQPEEDFGTIWAIRPELSHSDIYGDSECPDVRQFEDRDQLLKWLDEPGASISNRRRRWYGRIAVRDLQRFEGNSFRGRSFKEFIASGPGLVAWPSLERDLAAELRRTFADEDPPISCKLGANWDFEGIVRDCRFRPGHKFEGCEICSFANQICLVVDDLQRAFRRRHTTASVADECCFLESWDVLRNVAEFCGKTLATSQEARNSMNAAGMRWAECEDYVEAARRNVRVRLAVYVADIGNAEIAPTPGTERAVESNVPGRDMAGVKSVRSIAKSPTPIDLVNDTNAFPATEQTGCASALPPDLTRLIADKVQVSVFDAARYLELSDGHVRRLVRRNVLVRVGRGRPIKVCTKSLRKYKGR